MVITLSIKKNIEEIKRQIEELYMIDGLSYDEHISSGNIADVTYNRAVKIMELKSELERYNQLIDLLTDNELQVIEYTSEGLSKRDIACKMHYSVDNIYKIYNLAVYKISQWK